MGTEREQPLSEAEADFQATAESVAADAERLRGIEQQKARLDPADERRSTLSEEAVRLADEIKKKTTVELELQAEAAGSGA